MTQVPSVSVVRAHLLKHFGRVIGDSACSFERGRLASMRDLGVYVVEGPSQLLYDDPGATFEAPPGRYVWISLGAGRVMELIAGLTERAVPLSEAHERAGRIHESLASLPFEETRPLRLGFPDLVREMEGVTANKYERPLAAYRLRDVRWSLRLHWLGSSAPSPQDAYFLSMRWSSEAVENTLRTRVYEKRAAHGDEHRALPLAVWMRNG